MKLQHLVIMAIASILLSGCATTEPLNFSVPNVGVSHKRIDAELKSITVTLARSDEKNGAIFGELGDFDTQIYSPLWQTSLVEALNRMVIFQDDMPKKVNLSVKILKIASLPGLRARIIMEVTARYEIIDRKTGDLIFTQDISSMGTTPDGYSTLDGMPQIRASTNRAVQNNIAAFLLALETVDFQRPMFPAMAGVTKQ